MTDDEKKLQETVDRRRSERKEIRELKLCLEKLKLDIEDLKYALRTVIMTIEIIEKDEQFSKQIKGGKMNWKEIKGMLSFTFVIAVGIGFCIGFLFAKEIVNKRIIPQEKYERLENLGTMLITNYHLDECKIKVTKTGEKPTIGTCGISPDLKDILWMDDWIYVEGYGEFRVNTLTHKKDKTTGLPQYRVIDIFTEDISEAKQHGAKRRRVYLIDLKRKI